MTHPVQGIFIDTRHRVYCPLCGTEVDTVPNGNGCAHLIYAASDEGFEFARPRYLEALGLPIDTEGIDIESAYAAILEAAGQDEDDSYENASASSITDVAHLDGEFRVTYSNPGPFGMTVFFGFAPLPWGSEEGEEDEEE